MADKTIDSLLQDTEINGDESIPVFQNGTTKKITVQQILDKFSVINVNRVLVVSEEQPNYLNEGDMWLSTSSGILRTKVQNQFIEI